MCTITYTPENVPPISEDKFADLRDRFGSTIGVMWHYRRKVLTLKSNDTAAANKAVYEQYLDQVKKGRPAILHFRAGGPIYNCQPFTAWKDRLGFALNHGVTHYCFRGYQHTEENARIMAALKEAGNPNPSDAAAFGLGFLDKLPAYDLTDAAIQKAIDEEVRPHDSKMAFMDGNGYVYLHGDGCWSPEGHWNSCGEL